MNTQNVKHTIFSFRTMLVVLFGIFSTLAWAQPDTNEIELPFPIENNIDPTQSNPQRFDLGDPTILNQTVVYDPVTGTYIFKETIGNSNLNYRNPSMMTLEEFLEYERQQALKDNWKDRIDQQTKENQALIPPIKIESKAFENFFGSNEISIRPQGSVEVSLGVNSSRYDNPMLPIRQRKVTRFDFQQQIQMNLVGQIGTKIKLNTSYNTQAAFDFDNITKLGYNGNEDQIMQKIEAGNVSLPLPTSLIQGSQTLFGVRTQLKFGRLTVDGIAASSRGRRQEINITGKNQVTPFELTADNYEANKHYFLNYYFRDNYNNAMSELPIPRSEINITRMEVWLTNRVNNTENTRNIIAFSDLGEAKTENLEGNPTILTGNEIPSNNANNLYQWVYGQPLVRGFSNAVQALSAQNTSPGPFEQAIEYEKVENARKLSEQEYNYNALLGFISLNLPLNNDEVLAVAYEYTYRGETYQVGEFSTDGIDGQQALFMKLLKPTITSPRNKVWDLMMKNVYSIGAYQLSKEGFRMDILYNNPETSLPIPFFPYDGVKDVQLVTLLEMDKLNMNNQPFSDGLFDFAPMTFNGARSESGGTINPRNGRVYFTTIEPFGATLKAKMIAEGIPEAIVDRAIFSELYDSTKTAAQQIPSKNRFLFKGEYQSSITSDIPLNALNVPQGAVTVTAGGINLIEGQDYTVDYNLGRVKILNTGILESNTPIKVAIESNSVFGFQAKSLLGTRLNYRFSEDLNIGGTWMRMMERPVTQKVDIGNEPFKNNVLGFDIAFRKDVPFLTKLVDMLPGISTKAKSSISFTGEVAHLIPGSPRAITKEGISYIDDFEGSQTTIDLRSYTSWRLATVPQGQPDLFPEGNQKNLSAGFNRSRLAWYQIDPLFYQGTGATPQHIIENPAMLSDSRMRLVSQKDIYPNLQIQYGTIPNIPTLDLAFYPSERGMYNFDTTNTVDADGRFINPENRWGGIMRALATNDFEQANIEYIQFWILDPFNVDAEAVNPNTLHSGGDLYFNLGNISEDILPDSRKSFENGLPTDPANQVNLDTTVWGRVSTQQVVVNAFDNNSNTRALQDVGLDGWSTTEERAFYQGYVNFINTHPTLSNDARQRMLADPSNDDFKFFRDDQYDAQQLNILERYKRFNGMEGNSFTDEMSANLNAAGYSVQATNLPDIEDINQDNNLSETESYFQYQISLRSQDLQEGKNFITNIQTFQNGNKTERWIQFKVPVAQPQRVVNGIADFRSIRFMRMYLKGFDEEVVVRFARLEFVRGEWRRFLEDLTTPGESVQVDPNLTSFIIGALNVEENDQRQPIKYEIPPGIQREVDPSQIQQRQMNEQSLTLEVCDLQDGDARAAYRNVQFDVRTYKKLKLFVHAEEVTPSKPLKDEDVTLFVRLGTDFTDNYYEYELPLNLTAWGSNLAEDIWPESNNVEIDFDDLLNVKKKRNKITGDPNSSLTNNVEYVMVDPKNPKRLLKVKGSPNLQGLRSIMIGVRNPHQNDDNPWADDGQAKCAIIWVNELRLTDFQNEGGSAAVARLQVQAADFANMSVSGNYSGINWGSVESRVQDRQRNEQMGFDFNTNMQLGQLLGKRVKLSLPFFYGYSVGVVNPEYDPFNPDIRLADYDDLAERREKARVGQDFVQRKSYNFTNVRKELKAGAKPHAWRIENFSLNYSYSEDLQRDFNTEFDRTKLWRGGFNYNYSFQAKPIEPFKKIKFMQKSKWWSIVRDANFFLTPKNISMTNDLMRSYNERQVRNNISPDFAFNPFYVKSFTWNRTYDLGYDITKNLKFNFQATNRAIFDEANGRVDRKGDPTGYQQFRDSIRTQMATLGKAIDYTHGYNLSYNLPLDKIPALNWVTANVKYSGTFNWQRAPLGQTEYGNIIQNSRTINMTTQMNFTNLYNKVPYFKKVNDAGKPTRINVRQANNTSDGGTNATQKNPTKKTRPEYVPEKPIEEMTEKELRKHERKKRRFERKQDRIEKREERKVNPIAGFGARLLMSVRNVSGTYAQTNGTLLPGYNQSTSVLGFNDGFNRDLGGFIFGQQRYDMLGRETNYNIANVARDNNWLVQNSALNRAYTISHTQNISGRASLEPIKDLNIDLTLTRNYMLNSSEFYRYNDLSDMFESQSRVEMGNLTYSTISMRSAFTKISSDNNYQSEYFNNMLTNRKTISTLLGDANPNSTGTSNGYATGYGGSQQEVIIGAFLSSYTNNNANERGINPIKNIPLPNWTLNYNGLAKFPFMKKYVKNFVLKHAYSSTVNLSGMQTNLNAKFDNGGNATARDSSTNFIANRQIQNITVAERFSPLIGIDATWNVKGQALITRFEYRKDRQASLSLNNNQVTEIYGNEIIFGTGYKIEKVRFPFKIKNEYPRNPLNIRIDFSFRDNITVIRKVVEETNQATAGQRVVSIKSSADYNLGQNLTIQLYYDQVINTPKIATTFPTGNTNAGIRLRLNLAGL